MANYSLFPPLLLIVVFTVAILIYIYFEYLKQLNITTFMHRKLNPDLIAFIQSSDLFSSEIYEDESILVMIEEPENQVDFIPVPKELVNYQFLLNPVRLAILKILHTYTNFESSLIREELGISWGKYTSHLNQLETKRYIESNTKFIDDQTKKVVSITPFGIQEFELLQSLLQSLVRN